VSVAVQCHTCSKPAPVQWVDAEKRFRYQRHFIGDGPGRVRCPASGEPIPAPTGVVLAPKNPPPGRHVQR
jgi:hypothetical protein